MGRIEVAEIDRLERTMLAFDVMQATRTNDRIELWSWRGYDYAWPGREFALVRRA
jgi:hypothetical protein